jgi:hypothetical protein
MVISMVHPLPELEALCLSTGLHTHNDTTWWRHLQICCSHVAGADLWGLVCEAGHVTQQCNFCYLEV